MSARGAFRALSHRNFRLYIFGQGLSLIGTWMQQLAMSWLVYRLTGSSALLGVAVFCSQIPMLFLSPVAGVISDRIDKRRVVIATQALLMVQAALLAVLSFTGAIRVWQILGMNVLFGLINSLDMPARQSMVAELVDNRGDVGNAVALTATMVNLTRLIGPAVAGLVISVAGESACFAFNAASFVAVIASLSLMRLRPAARSGASRPPVMRGFRDGVSYAFGFEPIGAILTLLATVSLMGMPYSVLMPVFAARMPGGGPHTMGFLTAASGLGALAGALYLASRDTVRGLLGRIALCAALFGAALVAFALSSNVALSAVILFFGGFGVMVMMAASNTVLQTVADDDKRGRVMSLYVTSLMGIAPLGGLAAGAAAERWGASLTVAMGGACCMLGAGVFALRLPALRRQVRPVYARKGVPPAVETALDFGGRLKP